MFQALTRIDGKLNTCAFYVSVFQLLVERFSAAIYVLCRIVDPEITENDFLTILCVYFAGRQWSP